MKLCHVSTAFLVTCLLLLCSQGKAEVIATGNVSPSGATDPWEVVSLMVGIFGEGTLNIEVGGTVNVASRLRNGPSELSEGRSSVIVHRFCD